jgi:hypothetical protein
MRLNVTQNGQQVNQLQFNKGPVVIGRHPHCQLLLTNKDVSGQHAVLYVTNEGRWLVKDLRSANKTLLNGRTVDKTFLSAGDQIQIANYTIEIDLEEEATVAPPHHLDDTLIPHNQMPQNIMRGIDSDHAPPLHIPASRITHLLSSMETMTGALGPEGMLDALQDLLMDQFHAFRVWCAFRYGTQGPMISQGGKTLKGQPFALKNKGLLNAIKQACDRKQFCLIVHPGQHLTDKTAQSVMIAPVFSVNGNFGVLCIESTPDSLPYSHDDLDYAMLLSLYLAVVLENF